MKSTQGFPPSRKTLLAGIALGAVVSLTACSGGNTGTLGSGQTGSTKNVPITVIAAQGPWYPAFAAVAEEYQRETGNKVTMLPTPNNEIKSKEVNDVQSGQHAYDIYTINETDMSQFMSNNWVQPFDSIDSAYKLDSNIFTYNDLPYWNASKKLFDKDGKITSVPINGNVQILMYRKDIYKDLGLSTPKSWDDIVSNGQKAMASGSIKHGGAFRLQPGTGGTPAISYDFEAIMAGEGATWFAKDGTDWTPTVDSPQGIKAATVLRELAKLGPSATTTMGQAQAIALMQSGDAAQAYLVTAAAPQLESASNSNVGGKMGYAQLPVGPDGASTASGIWSLGIPASLPTDRAKSALDFIKWVTSQKAQTLFAEKGGVPIRPDYDTSKLSATTKEFLTATADAAKNATGQFRYPFAPDMMTITEPILGNIAAGTVSPSDGMKQMQQQLSALIKKEGLPMR